ncbi:MBOAT family O-acyltransferase [Aureivirga marina]|uniref:MBOAT family O-acyltransferase n=1 Tax=Aureivirga marina TaxID=1182451 RepID=UPI0018C8FDFD|nr:MBOAT family protein [Aureivirga marina]
MLFNSIDFAIFLPIFFILYWFVTNKNLKYQNFLILIASYIFYGWWDWRFLSLIIFSTIIDYTIGLRLKSEENQTKRKILLYTSILINLGFLGFFKYFNFFIDNFASAFSFFGKEIGVSSLDIVLPVGISFYTFQTLSYTIDVYKKKLEPTNDFISFAAFVSFFPQLVAGPIERATNLLPQFYKKRTFNSEKAIDGLRQILWGLFKKVVIADSCAEFANQIFNNSADMNGSTLVLGAIFFTFQIYGDFSGYSDIAIGTSRLFGFNLMQNFNFPYFSRDMAEFWRRWHISLSTWFRDYLYIPLGGSKGGNWMRIRNTFIIFLVSGFWHGANWTFIIWGLLNALYFLPLLLMKKNRSNMDVVAKGKVLPSFKEFIMMSFTFSLAVLAWIFFRAENLTHAFSYIQEMFSSSLLQMPEFEYKRRAFYTILFLIFFILVEWSGRGDQYAIEKIGLKWKRPIRTIAYYGIIIAILWSSGSEQDFIYFQF